MDCEKHGGETQSCQGKRKEPDKKLKEFTEDVDLVTRLAQIKHKIMVLSGKGGVGKSTVAVNIAVALAMEGKQVGILDVDFHGPSIPTLLKLNGKPVKAGDDGILPVDFVEGIKVMSIGFLMQEQDRAVIWRGPMKINVIKQLLAEVDWGYLDYLVLDFPPGTGDEPLSVAQLIPDADGAIIVTTPQDLSLIDVRKSIDFCKQLNVPILGVIENMSGFVCPHCKNVVDIFKRGGGEKMAGEMGVPFLGRIPIEPLIVEASDNGKPFIYHYGKTPAAEAFAKAIKPILEMTGT
jgi:Mrp family chromosome partitioning ATPase